MKVVSFKICPFVQRVTALLEAKRITYEVEYISLKNKPQWFLDVSPNGQVPVLITDNGQALFESSAIVEYLEEAYPALEPDISLESKAANRAWSYLASKNYLVQCSAQRSPDRETLQERSQKLGKAFDRLEKQLGEMPYFAGDTIGMVDIAWLPILHRANIVEQHSGYDFVGDRPKLKAWQQSLLSDELAERSVAPDFTEAFNGFYLSHQTYLGRGREVGNRCFSGSCATDACC